ncbi:DUF2637 domain-containing protein [Streptomyces sp. NPDC048420]|uniref:DUF2637 domain-containing protein n=1 Tax=Streptomyces sp. NPDC048420 TaxID=3155755 RepID=UPI0034377993
MPHTSISASSPCRGGADNVSASLWPLSVDGLLLLAAIGLLRHPGSTARRARWAAWSAFLLGIAVSLAANVAAAPAPDDRKREQHLETAFGKAPEALGGQLTDRCWRRPGCSTPGTGNCTSVPLQPRRCERSCISARLGRGRLLHL